MSFTRRGVITSAAATGLVSASSVGAACGPSAAQTDELDVGKLKTVFKDDFSTFVPYDPVRNPAGHWTTAGLKAFDGSIGGKGRRTLAQIDSDPRTCLGHRAPRNAGQLAIYADETLDPALKTTFAGNGELKMIAKPISASLKERACGRGYIAPRIWLTDGGKPKGFQYGYFEARIKFDVDKGAHAAFWLFPIAGRWTSEIDIVEYLGVWSKRMDGDQYHTSTHINSGAASLPQRVKGQALNKVWRRYGVLWNATSLTFYLDRRPVRRMPNPGIHEPMYPILNLAVATRWALQESRGDNLSDLAKLSHQMTIDEVLIAQDG